MLNTGRFTFSPTFGEAIKSDPIVLADAELRRCTPNKYNEMFNFLIKEEELW